LAGGRRDPQPRLRQIYITIETVGGSGKNLLFDGELDPDRVSQARRLMFLNNNVLLRRLFDEGQDALRMVQLAIECPMV